MSRCFLLFLMLAASIPLYAQEPCDSTASQRGILFYIGTARLHPQSDAVLDSLATWLLAHPQIQAGCTWIPDPVDMKGDPVRAARQRSWSIVTALQSRGVPASQVRIEHLRLESADLCRMRDQYREKNPESQFRHLRLCFTFP